jgi:tetratricopeptide (TPR) repeat protein
MIVRIFRYGFSCGLLAWAGGIAIAQEEKAAGAAAASEPPKQEEPVPVSIVQEGWDAFYTGDYRRALSEAKRLYDAQPDDPEIFEFACEVNLTTGYYKVLEKQCRERLARMPGDLPAMERLGEGLLLLGQYEEAERLLQGVLSKDRFAYRARYFMGRLYEETGRPDQALETLEVLPKMYQVSESKKADPVHYYAKGLGILARLTGDPKHYQLAGDDILKMAQELNPRDVRPLCTEAYFYILEGYRATKESITGEGGEAGSEYAEEEQGENPLTEAVMRIKEMNPNAPEFNLIMGLYNQVVAVNPHSPEAHLSLAREALGIPSDLHMMLETPWRRLDRPLPDVDLEKASGEIEKALFVNPNSAEAIALKGVVAWLSGDRSSFETHALKAREIQPGCATPEHALALVLTRFGRWEEAMRLEEGAVVRNGRFVPSLAHLGFLYAYGGRESEGVDTLKKAWEVDRFNIALKNTLVNHEHLYGKKGVAVTEETAPGVRLRMERSVEGIDSGSRIRAGGSSEGFQWGAKSMRKGYVNEAFALGGYIRKWLADWVGECSARYGKAAPLTVELIKHANDYRVRMTGLDVPMGKVIVAADGTHLVMPSPYLLMPQQVPWGIALRKGFVEIWLRSLVGGTLPPWLAEAIAQREVERIHPEWDNDEALIELWDRWKEGAFPSVAEMAGSWSREADEKDKGVPLALGVLFVRFVEDRWKEDGMRKILSVLKEASGNPNFAAWASETRKGAFTGICTTLGSEPEEIEKTFREWLIEKHLGGIRRLAVGGMADYDRLAQQESLPDDEPSLKILAVGAYKRGDLEKASAAAQKGASKYGSAEFHLVLGGLLSKKGSKVEGLASYEQARKKGLELFELFKGLGDGYAEIDRKEAIRFYRAAIEACSQGGREIHKGLFKLLKDEGREEEAWEVVRQALDLDPKDWKRMLWAARKGAELGRASEALSLFEGIFIQHPYDMEARHYWGMALVGAKQVETGIRQMEEALETLNYQPGTTPADLKRRDELLFALLCDMAETYAQAGNMEKAKEHYFRALTLGGDGKRLETVRGKLSI